MDFSSKQIAIQWRVLNFYATVTVVVVVVAILIFLTLFIRADLYSIAVMEMILLNGATGKSQCIILIRLSRVNALALSLCRCMCSSVYDPSVLRWLLCGTVIFRLDSTTYSHDEVWASALPYNRFCAMMSAFNFSVDDKQWQQPTTNTYAHKA